MEREGPEAFQRTAAEVMHREPRRVIAGTFAEDALALMEAHRITSLIVSDASEGSPVLGVVHMHDLLEALGPAPGAAAAVPFAAVAEPEKKLS